MAGGLLRFERVGRVLRARGNHLSFVCFASNRAPKWQTEFEVLSFEECARQTWDCVMVPGAGFTRETIEGLSKFREARFGLRVQHILNDQNKKERFLQVNRSFNPDAIVFNNEAWTDEEQKWFAAKARHTIVGAVDSGVFGARKIASPLPGQKIVIGGLANKNAAPLVQALTLLPSQFELHLFGDDREIEPLLVASLPRERWRLAGLLPESQLPNFYAGIHLAVHTEMRGGWSNFAAEASASGIPLICTPHATSAFARHSETATVMPSATATEIRSAIIRLAADWNTALKMAANARVRVEPLSWESYTTKLLDALNTTSSQQPHVI